MKKCKSCNQKEGVYGIDDISYTEIGGAIVSAMATAQIDKAVTKNEDGTAKDNFLANNPMVKNALYLIGGGLLTSMDGEMYKGAGVGMATYGGFNLVQSLMEQYMPTTNGINGLQFIPPRPMIGKTPAQTLGLFNVPGSSAVAPSVLGTSQEKMQLNFSELTKEKQTMPKLRR